MQIESVCITKELNSHRTGLVHQHGHRFIVLGHQYGRRDVMWKHSIDLARAKRIEKLSKVLYLYFTQIKYKIADENTTATATKIAKKKRTLLVQHTFLFISLPFFGTATTRNFRGCLYTEPGLDSFSLSRHFQVLQVLWPLTGRFSWQSWKKSSS